LFYWFQKGVISVQEGPLYTALLDPVVFLWRRRPPARPQVRQLMMMSRTAAIPLMMACKKFQSWSVSVGVCWRKVILRGGMDLYLQDTGDAVDDGHEAGAYGLEDAFDLFEEGGGMLVCWT